MQIPAILKAKEMGLQVVAVDRDPQAPGFEYADVCLPISTVDVPNVVKAAARLKVDGVMTLATDMPVRTVAAVAKELDIPGIDEQAAINATDKIKMCECLNAGNVPIPAFFGVSNEEEYFRAVSQFDRPFIVKPADSSGSRGVSLVTDISDQNEVKNAYKYSLSKSGEGNVIVEEYMEGPEVSVETLSVQEECHIIQITDKLTNGSPHFVEMGHSEPTILSEVIQKEIERIVTSAVSAIGIKDGPSHTEVKVTGEGPKIVEIGARLGGGYITSHLVPLSTGVDMVECCIRIAMNEKPDLIQKYRKAAAIRYVKADPGRILEISGVEDAKKVHGVREVNILRNPGDQSVEIICSNDRIGSVIAQADTPAEAVKICEDAIDRIKVTVVPD